MDFMTLVKAKGRILGSSLTLETSITLNINSKYKIFSIVAKFILGLSTKGNSFPRGREVANNIVGQINSFDLILKPINVKFYQNQHVFNTHKDN